MPQKAHLTLILFLLTLSPLNAQSVDSLASYHFQKIWPFYRQSATDSAAYHATAALPLYRQLLSEQPDSLITYRYTLLHKHLSAIALQKNELTKAEVYAGKSLELAEQNFGNEHELTALARSTLAFIMQRQGRFRDAVHFQQAFLNYLEKHQLETTIDYVKTFTALQLNPYASTDEQLAQSFQSYQYNLLGYYYRMIEEVDQAIFYHQKGLSLRKSIYGEKHPYVAYDYRQLASAYLVARNIPRTKELLEKALRIQLELTGELHPTVADIYNDRGLAYFRVDDFANALKYWEQALEIRLKLQEQNTNATASAWNNVALAHSNLGNLDLGIKALKQAIAIRTKRYGDQHASLIPSYNNLSLFYQKQEDTEAALSALNKAFSINVPQATGFPNVDASLLDHDITDENALIISLHYLAMITGFHALSPDADNLSRASAILEITAALNDRRLNRRHHEQARLLSNSYAGTTDLIRTEILFHYDKREELGNDFYEILERVKSQLLRRAMMDKELMEMAGIPWDISRQISGLHKQITSLEQQLGSIPEHEATQDRRMDLQNQLLAINKSYDSLFQHIDKHYPAYTEFHKSETIVPLEVIQQSLEAGSVMISFFEGNSLKFINRQDGLFALVITPDHTRMYKLIIPPDYQQGLQKFQSELGVVSMTQEAFTTFCKSAHHYYQVMLEPILKDLEGQGNTPQKLILLPDDNLHYLPFEVLLTELPDTNQINYRELPYLLKKYTVTYANSASLWKDQQDSRPKNRLSYIGFAPYYQTTSNAPVALRSGISLTRLDGIEKEVKQAQAIFGGQAFIGENATEARFKQSSGQPAILHLAMHAMINDQNPLQSGLYFTRDSLSNEDSKLNAYEIYSQAIEAQLVVLSACETGTGARVHGEGILSISRAFTYAGCPAMVMSLWQANDKYTPALMQSFFKALSEGQDKAVALRQAKLHHLATTDASGTHPANWAAFVVLGNNRPIKFPASNFWWLLLPLALLLGSTGYFLKKK